MSGEIDDYENLKKKGLNIRLLSSVSMLLEWDQEVFMPKEGIDFRSKQIELITSLTHQEKTSPEYQNALGKLVDLKTGKVKSNAFDERKKASLRELHSDYLTETKLPNAFVKKLAKAHSQGVNAWQTAKQENQYELFLPHLQTIFSLHQEKGKLLDQDKHPYDSLLNLYEKEMTMEKLDSLFQELKPFLSKLTKTLSKKQESASFLSAHYPLSEQQTFNHFLMEKMGIDFKCARLDFSAHPFCSGFHPHDVRLTTFTSTTSFFNNIFAVLHEGGHALYELALPSEELGTPLAEAASFGIHESQSIFWECFIGKGRPFWEFALPQLKKAFPKQMEGITLDLFYQAINHVEPSLIRVYADEVTYILHIILRYEIEKELLSGEIDLQELPSVWNEKMEASFGITPKTDSEGCLQDIHWAFGLIGYFPSYALGKIYAAQLYQTLIEELPDFAKTIAGGDLSFIKHFLYEKIHRYGRQYTPLELIEKGTGSPLSPKPFTDYLNSKYV
ncbi:MAG: carboxypeptidase M32 [Chlamydiia bacterium]|nr:carboxypeptidase M32 [Chlamydiia bacterium]